MAYVVHCLFVVSFFKRLIFLFSLNDLKSTSGNDFLKTTLGAYSKKSFVIFLNVLKVHFLKYLNFCLDILVMYKNG